MPSIKAIEVRLDVEDVPHSARFYADALGFQVGTMWPEASPEFAILSRDGLRLQLGKAENEIRSANRPACSVWLDVAEIDDLYSALKEKVTIEWGPEVYFYTHGQDVLYFSGELSRLA